jgi:hypothetical protein
MSHRKIWLYSGAIYSDDYETNNFDQYSARDDASETQIKQQLPPSTPMSPFANNRTMPRPCDKRVDLYILQPDRLNTSGQFNPLKGKLTNCHVTGCERCVSSAVELHFLQLWRVLTMVYNTQKYWVSGLCPSSGLLDFVHRLDFQIQEMKLEVFGRDPVIEVSFFQGTRQSRWLPSLTWGWKEIQFPKRCVFLYHLEFRMIDKVHRPSNSDSYNSALWTANYWTVFQPVEFGIHKTFDWIMKVSLVIIL